MEQHRLNVLAARSGEAADLLRAMANQQRLLILCHLIEAGEMSVTELGAELDISQSAVSQHLARLRDEGLVAFRRDAQTLHYRVADPRAAALLTLLHDLFCPKETA